MASDLRSDESEQQVHPDDSRPRRWGWIVVIALTGLAVGGWYLLRGNDTASQGRGRPAATVGIATATAANIPVILTAVGTVQPIVNATVRSQVAGTLVSVAFTEGQQVKQGQTLALVDPRPFHLAVAQAEANLLRDQAQLAAAKVDLQRYQGLLAQDSIARQQVDAQAALVGQLEGAVAADRAAVGTAKLNLSYTDIKAPVSGTIGLRQVDLGDYVTTADANGIATITQQSPIDVAFSLPQAELMTIKRKLATGAVLSCTARDQFDQTALAEGRFLTLDNQIDPTSGTVKAKARFDNADGALFPNQFVNIALLVDTLRDVVAVPVSAVRHGVQGDFVFVLQPDKTAKLQLVRTGPSDGSKVAVLSGLKSGHQVITEGADGLDDGSRVSLPGDARPAGGAASAANGQGRRRAQP